MAGVQGVSEAVAEEVEGEDAEGDGEGGKEDEVGSFEEVGAGGIEHGAPGGGGRLDAEAEKAESGFGEDGGGHADGGLHQNRLERVRKDRAEEEACVRGAERAGGLNKFALAQGENLGTGEAGVPYPCGEGQGENEVGQAGAEEGDDGNGEENAGEGEKGVGEIDVDDDVEPATIKAGDSAEKQAQGEGDCYHGDGDAEGDAGAEENAGEDVAAEFVGSAEVGGGGRGEAVGEIDGRGILRREHRGKKSQHREEDDHRQAGEGESLREQAVQPRDAGGGGGSSLLCEGLGGSGHCRSSSHRKVRVFVSNCRSTWRICGVAVP